MTCSTAWLRSARKPCSAEGLCSPYQSRASSISRAASGWKISLGATASVHEPFPEVLPGNSLDCSGFELHCTAFELGYPGVFLLRIVLLQAVEQPGRHLGTVMLVQLQRLSNDLIHLGFHGGRVALPWVPRHAASAVCWGIQGSPVGDAARASLPGTWSSGAADVHGGGALVGKGAAEDLLHLLRVAQNSQRLSGDGHLLGGSLLHESLLSWALGPFMSCSGPKI